MTFIPPETGKPCPCCGRMVEALPDNVAKALAKFAEKQEPMGAEFERVWDENVDKLYTP